MPLRDHFHSPLNDSHSWDEIHGQWPAVMVQHLTRSLPPEYTAAPRVYLGTQFEVDVATFGNESIHTADFGSSGPGGLVTATWAPAAPTLAVKTELSDFDEYEVRVYDARRGRRLVSAVELISPANKDRPEQRTQFTAKCAALLRQGVSVLLVDIVTSRSTNLYADLLDLIGEEDPALGARPMATYAVACRWHWRARGRWLETWHHTLSVGAALPCVPLWLSEDLAIPLELEASYEQTCRDLRIA